MHITEIQPYLTFAKDLVTLIAAGVAAYVGISGLHAWQRQLKGNAEYDLARRVLVAVYKVRDAIEGCRMIAWEGDSSIVDVTKQIHDSMFDKLDEAKAGLDVELLEAEAVWGSEPYYRRRIILLQSLVTLMKGAYSSYYGYISVVSPPEIAERIKKTYALLFTETIPPKDDFSIQVNKTISNIENFLRPKLTLKRENSSKNYLWNRFKRKK